MLAIEHDTPLTLNKIREALRQWPTTSQQHLMAFYVSFLRQHGIPWINLLLEMLIVQGNITLIPKEGNPKFILSGYPFMLLNVS